MIKVKAVSKGLEPRKTCGIYGNKRYKPGDIFFIKDENELGKWMEVIKEGEPDPETVAETQRLESIAAFKKELEALTEEDLVRYAADKSFEFKKKNKKEVLTPENMINQLVEAQFPATQ